MVAGSLMLGSAQAASFDCAKAGTNVEKMICGNAELSRLDEELGVAYKVAVRNKSQAESVRSAQKEWLKKRNVCNDEKCLISAYTERKSQLPAIIVSNVNCTHR